MSYHFGFDVCLGLNHQRVILETLCSIQKWPVGQWPMSVSLSSVQSLAWLQEKWKKENANFCPSFFDVQLFSHACVDKLFSGHHLAHQSLFRNAAFVLNHDYYQMLIVCIVCNDIFQSFLHLIIVLLSHSVTPIVDLKCRNAFEWTEK